jgi:hypothetical protein
LDGSDPFAPREASIPADRRDKSLESLLAYQIRHNSGGIEFTVADLHAVARISALLIVLDGFDEVADVDKRNLVVDEIEKAIYRLEATSASLQVIITSRPAAFANSPGFPEASFPHFDLQSLTLPLINEYAKKWMDARHLSGRDRRDFANTLQEKVNQPHMRDLARNPMQLTILLSLIHTRGTSLPDKRTALYDNYMDTFFSREAEKSPVVREHRDLLISLHQYLAWILHTESEGGHNRGSVTRERLEQLVSEYLAREGHNTDLVDQLFVGMVERVVALVSRVQGTFEFEVQPLREYFAARFLNETAPYSPPGAERKGTKPDRFDAVAKNFYWLNVTRFFAGCFSKGELASLVDSLELIFADRDFNAIGYPRDLAAMLLSDWVFAQQPRLVDKVAKLILTGQGLRTLIASAGDRRSFGHLSLPEKCGRATVLDFALEEIRMHPPADYRRGLARIAVENSDSGALCGQIVKILSDVSPKERAYWLRVAVDTGVIRRMSIQDLEYLSRNAPFSGNEMGFLLEGGRTDFFEQSKTRFKEAIRLLLEGGVCYSRPNAASPLSQISEMLTTSGYFAVLDGPSTAALSLVRYHYHPGESDNERVETKINTGAIADEPQLIDILEFYAQSTQRPVGDWIHGLDLWNELIERARNLWGNRWCLFPLAGVASAVDIDAATLVGCENLLDFAAPLCSRAAYAKSQNANSRWWMNQLNSVVDDTGIVLVLLLMFLWAGGRVISDMFDLVEEKLDTLTPASWNRFYSVLPEVMWVSNRRAEKGTIRISKDSLPACLSPRLAASMLLMSNRVSRQAIFTRYLSEYDGEDETILTILQSVAINFARASTTSWKKALEISKSTYKKNIASEYPFFPERAKEMPLELARRVCDKPDQYPLSVLAVAEAAIVTYVRKNIRPVAAIAREESWSFN